MGNPVGTRANRWNQVVSAVAGELGITTTEADTWLNGVWANMYVDERFGNITGHGRLKLWLAANSAGAPTLPEAFSRFVT